MIAFAESGLLRPVVAVLLAGAIRPSPLRAALGVHPLCLPVGQQGTLLDAWLSALSELDGLNEVLIVVNTEQEVQTVQAIARRGDRRDLITRAFEVRVVAERAAWRGAGGILRDVAADLYERAIILACEAKRLPPASLLNAIEPLHADGALCGVVGVSGRDEPAGVYAFTRVALECVPRIGYFDLKEQFLPLLGRSGQRVAAAHLGQQVWRLSDLESYLAALRQSLRRGDQPDRFVRCADDASISPSAILDGFCIVERGAVIEDGAVLHDAVVMAGATVGGGAVVTRSVIGPLANVEPRARVAREVVAGPSVTHQADPGAQELGRASLNRMLNIHQAAR